MNELEAVIEMKKAMKRCIRAMGPGMIALSGYIKIGKVTYDWDIKKDDKVKHQPSDRKI